MRTDLAYILVFGAMVIIQLWVGIVSLRFAWRSWNDPQVTVERFYSPWRIRLAEKLSGEERYRKWQAYIQRQSSRRLLAAMIAFVGTSVLFLAIWYAYMILAELLGWYGPT